MVKLQTIFLGAFLFGTINTERLLPILPITSSPLTSAPACIQPTPAPSTCTTGTLVPPVLNNNVIYGANNAVGGDINTLIGSANTVIGKNNNIYDWDQSIK